MCSGIILKGGKHMSEYLNLKQNIKIWKSDLLNYISATGLYHDSLFQDYSDYFDSEPRKNPVLFVMITEGEFWQGLNYGDSPIVDSFDRYITRQDYYYEIHSSCVLTFHLRNNLKQEQYYNYFYKKWLEKNSETPASYNIKIAELKKSAKETIEMLKNKPDQQFTNKIIVENYSSNMMFNEFYLVLSELESMAAIIKINKYGKPNQDRKTGNNLPWIPSEIKDNEIIITGKKKIDNNSFYSFEGQTLSEIDERSNMKYSS